MFTFWTAKLIQAVEDDDLQAVRLAIENNAEVNLTVLLDACRGGNRAILEFLAECGMTIDRWDTGPMLQAIEAGRLAAVQFLVDQGVNKENVEWLKAAAKSGHCDITRYLLTKGAALSWDAVKDAIQGDHREVVGIMLKDEKNKQKSPRFGLKTVDADLRNRVGSLYGAPLDYCLATLFDAAGNANQELRCLVAAGWMKPLFDAAKWRQGSVAPALYQKIRDALPEYREEINAVDMTAFRSSVEALPKSFEIRMRASLKAPVER